MSARLITKVLADLKKKGHAEPTLEIHVSGDRFRGRCVSLNTKDGYVELRRDFADKSYATYFIPLDKIQAVAL